MDVRFSCHCYESPCSLGLYRRLSERLQHAPVQPNANIRAQIAGGHMPSDMSTLGGELPTFPAKMTKPDLFTENDVLRERTERGRRLGRSARARAEPMSRPMSASAWCRAAVARDIYGVVLTAAGGVDAKATAARRAAIRAERLSWKADRTLEDAPAQRRQGYGRSRLRRSRVDPEASAATPISAAIAAPASRRPARTGSIMRCRPTRRRPISVRASRSMPSWRPSVTPVPGCGRLHASRSSSRASRRCSTANSRSERRLRCPKPISFRCRRRWERDLDCGWVEFKSGKDDIRGYFAKPKGRRNLPGIVMMHENLGVIEHRQDVTRRLPRPAMRSLTVDLYSRIGGQSPRDFTTPEERRIKAFRAMPDEQVIPDLEAGCRLSRSACRRSIARASAPSAIARAAGCCTAGCWATAPTSNAPWSITAPRLSVPRRDRDGKPLERIRQADKLPCPIQIHQGEAIA